MYFNNLPKLKINLYNNNFMDSVTSIQSIILQRFSIILQTIKMILDYNRISNNN